MNDEVLWKNGRGHTQQDVLYAARLIQDAGLSLGLQMMIGLPGETWEMCQLSARKIAALKPDCVRLYPTLVVEGTDLACWYRAGEYVPLTLEEAVDQTAWLLRFFEDRDISVIRVGLHAEASLEQSCIAGPFHPAFGEMVYSRVWRKCLLDMLDQGDCREKVLEIFVRPQMLSKAVGQKRENVRWLADKGYEVTIRPDASLPATEPFRIKEVKHCI